MTTAEKLFENARECAQRQDFEQAFTLYSGAAELGYAPAQVNLGNAYLNGKGVARNDQMAVAWYQKAADQNHAVAVSNLGYCYSQGRGVPVDKYRALALYKKASDMGNELAGKYYQNLLKELDSSMTNSSPVQAAPTRPAPAPQPKPAANSSSVNLNDLLNFASNTNVNSTPRTNANTAQNQANAQALEQADWIIKNYKPTGIRRGCNRFISLFLFGIIAVFSEGGFDESTIAGSMVFVMFIAIALFVRATYPFHHRKKYYNKNHLNDLIRNDTGNMSVAIKTYNSMPGKKMLAYIKDLNLAAAQRIEQQLAAKK